MAITIGIIREGKTPPDKRVPFSPQQCQLLLNRYPQLKLIVQSSSIRAFKDEEYTKLGIEVKEDISEANVIFGVKEVPIDMLQNNKTYFFFSHTIKEQAYNRKLLLAVLEKNIKLVDYECLTNENGNRLVGFGRYAGIVGTYNGFLAYGKTTDEFHLKAAHLCHDRKEMEAELPKIKLPKDFKIVITGTGRVGGGALEVLKKMAIREVNSEEFLMQNFDEPVFTVLHVNDYNQRKDGGEFKVSEFYENPEPYESTFFRFAKVADMYITCHYWDADAPYIFTKEEMAHIDFKIRTIADISCDIDGPIPSTVRASTIANPIYYVSRKSGKEVETPSDDTITVMAVDNLPCELPKDASQDFGNELIKNIMPNLLGTDNDRIIDRASITENGELKADYEYLQDYVDGK